MSQTNPFCVAECLDGSPIVCSTDCSTDSNDIISCNRWRLLYRRGSSISEKCSIQTCRWILLHVEPPG
jgi:hypothetical protein